MDFKKYTSLINVTSSAAKRPIAQFLDRKAHAYEKVHGCNLSFQWEKGMTDVKIGSRSQFTTEDFRNTQGRVELFKRGAIMMINTLGPGYAQAGMDMKAFRAYGELAGGRIGGKSKYGQCKPIQQEVDYSEEFWFFPFRMELELSAGDDELTLVMDLPDILEQMDEEAQEGFKILGWVFPPLVSTGTLGDLLADLEIEGTQSMIPHMLGERAPEDNEWEGLAIYIVPESGDNGNDLPIFKYKTGAFTEKGKKRKIKVPEPLTAEEQELLDIMVSYVTLPRLLNVASHEGLDFEPKNIGLLIKNTWGDIVKDATADGVDLTLLKEVNKYINAAISKLVKQECL